MLAGQQTGFMLMDMAGILTGGDMVAFGFFLIVAGGYTLVVDHSPLSKRTISAAMNRQRIGWMREAMKRDLRILDTGILQIMMQGMGLFASTTIFVIGGLIAGIAYNGKLAEEFSTVPFVAANTAGQWSVKLALMLVLFVYAFFKFAWAIRLAHYSAILVGALVPRDEADTEKADRGVAAAARMASLCGHHFNRGLRAIFFAVGSIGWLFGPWLFVASTLFVVAVVARREFGSNALKAIRDLP